MRQLSQTAISSLIAILACSITSQAEEPPTLMGRIAEWRYPNSKVNGATMSDAATINEQGERTVPSIQCKAVLITRDPVAKVLEYYRSKVASKTNGDDAEANDQPRTDSSRSVTFHGDSENRPLALHMILINTDDTSTTLVISRAEMETETHIAWTQYVRLP